MGRRFRRAALIVLAVVAAPAAAVGFGMTPGDVRRVRTFADAVRRWQVNPDYRDVCADYVTLGAQAMRARVCGVSAGHVIMAFRSIPGLPDHLAVSDTSAAHHKAFSRGPLSAYLHLAGEQGVADGIAVVEGLGRCNPLTDEDLVAFLGGFKLPVPMVTDAGARSGVRRLLADIQPQIPLAIRGDIVTLLRSSVAEHPEEAAALAQLDGKIRATDRELWRAKQVNDFLAGIWAQGYGQIYLDGIEAFFRIRRAARFMLAVVLIGGAWVAAAGRGRPTMTTAAATA